MRRGRLAFAVTLLVSLMTMARTSTAASAPRGVFVSHCDYTHSLPDDPIVHPGAPGASHLHDFFGNKRTNADSTARTMVHGDSTCRFHRDTSGYWFPAGYHHGVRLTPTFSKTYYFGVARMRVDRIPHGLGLVAGNAMAASVGENPHASWSCGAKGHRRTPIVDHPYDCGRYARRWPFVDGVVGRVAFPSCWDGLGRGPADVAYVVDGLCPPGFPHRLPTIEMQVHFGILDPCLSGVFCGAKGFGTNVVLSLSSGPFYTLHADFWNTWHQRALDHLTTRCLEEHVRCGNVSDPRRGA